MARHSAERVVEFAELIPTQDGESLTKLAHAARRRGDRAAALAAFEAAAVAVPPMRD